MPNSIVCSSSTYLSHMSRLELIILAGLTVLCAALAILGLGAKQRYALAVFLEEAPRIEKALEHFAADHGQRFPPDAAGSECPAGLSKKYIVWQTRWKIDYEVHDNSQGGKFVCLEMRGQHNRYEGLCLVPEYRKQYPRGQAITGRSNRIWLIREDANIISPAG